MYKVNYANDHESQTAPQMVFGNCGVLHCPSLEMKGYVEMTSIDADTSHDIVEAISGKGGRYLEAQVIIVFLKYFTVIERT